MKLGPVLVKLAKTLELVGDGKALAQKQVDRAFTPLASVKTAATGFERYAMLDELVELGALPPGLALKLAEVTDEQARGSLNRLGSLEQNKPSLGQVGRYAALGAAAAPIANIATNAIRGKPLLDAGTNIGKLREVAGRAAGGAITGGAIPLLRSHLDRNAEYGTLRKYLNQNAPPSAV